ncbi:MAG: hypothetical protein H0W76_09005 [Pyrinomonadaceae bacterium]|nr:hypothetical protein [Pyrinomonadaceae bacterium]
MRATEDLVARLRDASRTRRRGIKSSLFAPLQLGHKKVGREAAGAVLG